MLRGLNVFPAPDGLLGVELLNELSSRGVQLVRQPLYEESGRAPITRDLFTRRRDELWNANMDVVWIVWNIEQITWLPPQARAEFRNEPDLYPTEQERSAYLQLLPRAFETANEAHVRLSPGAVSNLNSRGFGYLARILAWTPYEAPVAFHRYPNWPGPRTPHYPALTRETELYRLTRLTGGRSLWLTEFGYHTARWPDTFWQKTKQWTDEDVRTHVQWEWNFWAPHVELAVLYQLNDAAPETFENRYGIRNLNGTWKPVADTFQPH